MSYRSSSRFQYSALWGHLLYFAAGVGTSLFIYWITGGFPPSPWMHLWNVLSQMNSLWAINGPAVVFPIVVLGLQLLLFVLVGGASLGFVVYEVVMILDIFSVWQQLAFLRRWFNMLVLRLRAAQPSSVNAGKLQADPNQGRAAVLAPLVTVTSSAEPKPADIAFLPTLSQGILSSPERGNLVSNTMSPALPESMRWILRSPEALPQSEPETQLEQMPIEQVPTIKNAEKQPDFEVSQEITHHFFDSQRSQATEGPPPAKHQGTKPFADSLFNPFEHAEASVADSLANPFEQRVSERQIKETLPFLFPNRQEQLPFPELPGSPLVVDSEEDTLPSIFSGQQASEALEEDQPFEDPLASPFDADQPFKDPLANPFKNPRLPEDDPLANPFEEEEVLPTPSSQSKDLSTVKDPLANPFEEDTDEGDITSSLRAIRPPSPVTGPSRTSLDHSLGDRKEMLTGENPKSGEARNF